MVEFLDYPTVKPNVVQEVVFVDRLERRQPGFRYRVSSLPGHTIQCVIAGRTHLDFLTNLPLRRERLLQAIRDAWLTAGESERFTVLPTDLVKELVATKFGDPIWVTRL